MNQAHLYRQRAALQRAHGEHAAADWLDEQADNLEAAQAERDALDASTHILRGTVDHG